jgi:ABC-type branched-subunit amino acid transport system substrate-binding protein
MVALDAIKRAGTKDCAASLEAVRQRQDFAGVIGTFRFDENGDTNRTDVVGWTIKAGKCVYTDGIEPADPLAG